MMFGLVPTEHPPCCSCTPLGMPVRHMKPGSNGVGPGPSDVLCVSFTTNARALAHEKLVVATL